MSESFPSTDEQRTENNAMRHDYRVLTEEEKAWMVHLKDLGLEFVKYCDSIGAGRELSLAKTNMEQAVMWAVKHVTR
jgi:hypothetical protein